MQKWLRVFETSFELNKQNIIMDIELQDEPEALYHLKH